MNRVYERIATFALLSLALAPLLLYAYHSLFIRLFQDDYGYIGKAMESGTWGAMLFWRENWNGDYTNFLLYGALAPFAERAPTVMSLAFIAAGLLGSTWLVSRLWAFFGVGRHRRLAAFALAAMIIVAYINGAYSLWAYYWFSVVVEYSFPVVAFTVCLALGAAAEKWARSRMRLSIAAVAFVALGFLVAGFSEMYLVIQAVSLALLGIAALVFARGRERRAFLVIIAAALAGTALSLVAQLTSPGVVHRMALPRYWGMPAQRVNDLPALIFRVAELMPAYLTNQYALSGLKLLAAAGFFVTFTFSQPVSQRPRASAKAAAPWPYIVGLIIQLALLPYLWSYSSDSPVIFGRFSFSYALIVSLNIALVIAAIAMIWRPKRLRAYMIALRSQLAISGIVLLLIGALFALTEVRLMADRAYVYCLITSFLLAVMLLWQLSFGSANGGDGRAKRMGALTLWSAVLTIAWLAALLAVALRMQGFIYDYNFTPVVFPFVFTGLLWGASVGALMRRLLTAADAQSARTRWAGVLSLLVAAVISWNIVTVQTSMNDPLREGARMWDAAHQEILTLRNTDPAAIASRKFLSHDCYMGRHCPMKMRPKSLKWRQELFYGLDYTPKFGG